jgi:hypothetical protein
LIELFNVRIGGTCQLGILGINFILELLVVFLDLFGNDLDAATKLDRFLVERKGGLFLPARLRPVALNLNQSILVCLPNTFENSGGFSVGVKLLQHHLTVLINRAAKFNFLSDLLIEIRTSKFVTLPDELHLQTQRAADGSFEVFVLGRHRAALWMLILIGRGPCGGWRLPGSRALSATGER